MQRVREFSAERNDLAKSKLANSRNSSHLNDSKIDKYQIATPSSQKKASQNSGKNPSSSQASQRSSRSQYICTGCFNGKLASDKKQQRRNQLLRQKQLQSFNTEESLRNDHINDSKHSRLIKQFDETNKYNLKLMEQKQLQKQRQELVRNQENQKQKIELQNYFMQQKDRLIEKQKFKEKFRAEIQQQISYKRNKDKEFELQQNHAPVEDMFELSEELYYQQKVKREHHYRQDLLKQIKERDQAIQKDQANKNKIQNNHNNLAEDAYQRQIERRRKIQERQKQILEEAQRRQKRKEIKIQEQKKIRQRLQQQKLHELQEQQKLQRQLQIQRKKEIQNYKNDLKSQIQSRKKKRENQLHQTNELTLTSIQIAERIIDRKKCGSCDKKFPKTFLTKVK